MMKFEEDRLYNLLPAIYRLRDDALKESEQDVPPLKELIKILSKEVAHLEENLDQLYDDQFIETSSEWVIPYIGDLIGSRALIQIPDPKYTRRAEVANTISYRRRKGTVSIIEQLAKDVTNWDANVNEYFQLLITTQYLNHLRPHNVSVPDLRNWEQLEFANTPFDSIPKTIDVRNISTKRGKYNIPNIGIFLWRIKAYSISNSIAFKVDNLKYTFDPCGIDVPLYNWPSEEEIVTQLANPKNVALPIRRRLMSAFKDHYYGQNKKILIQIGSTEISVSDICIGELDQWDSGNLNPAVDKVIIDPELGRIMFGTNFTPNLATDDVIVNYNYGFSTDMGGGEYEREHTFTDFTDIITVSKENVPSTATHFKTIQEAIDKFKTTNKNGIVEIGDSKVYNEEIFIDPGTGLTIEIRAKEGKRPVIKVNDKLKIKGAGLSKVILNGLLIHGGDIEIMTLGKTELVKMTHCTLVPDTVKNKIRVKSDTAKVEIMHSITAGIELKENTDIDIANSIVDVTDNSNLAIKGTSADYGGVLKIINTTVVGQVKVKSLILAENVIFNSKVTSKRLQDGCVRFSYVSLESITPRKYSCQPTDETTAITIKPTFTAINYGHPAYCQLDDHCVPEIAMGADDESEMGVYHDLYQPQRLSNLRTRLDEYLRFGMEAGIFFGS